MLKHVNTVRLKKVVIRKERKVRRILSVSSPMCIQNRRNFKKAPILEKSKERYKIEAKNSELKHRHGYDVVKSSGLVSMQFRGDMAIFTVNLKRIMKLMCEK